MLLTEKLTAIADAVREKTGGDQSLTLDEIKEEIVKLSLVPTKPYIDSSTMDVTYFCTGGQNLDLLFHPNLGIFDAENISYFFYLTDLARIPTGSISFPFAKIVSGMFSNMNSTQIQNYGCDLSGLEVDLPSAENAESLFSRSMMGILPKVHIGESCRKAGQMFYQCQYLRQVDLCEAKNIETFNYMFYNCQKLQTVRLDMRSATNYTSMFVDCRALTDLSIGSLKIRDNNFRLDSCPSLTVESLVGVLEALESNVGEETTYTVVLGSENLAKLTDEQKQIAIDKNLTLA